MFEALIHADQYLFSAINGLAGRNETTDEIAQFFRDSYIAKGIPVMLVWWGLWFARGPHTERNRQYLLAGLIASIAAIFAGRALALTLPFRYRPLHHPELEVILPSGMTHEALMGWSSFPSDHAVLFFALATAIFLVHRGLGIVFYIHAAIAVSLPRIFLAIHFPGDVLFGAFVGVSIILFLVFPLTMAIKKFNVLQFIERYSHLSYPIIFFVTFQAASMFDSARELVKLVYHLATPLLSFIQ